MAQHRQYSAPAIETLTTRIHGGLALDRLIGPSTHSIACDRCFKIIDVGELRYACLECYGWLSPEGQTATVRQVKMQRTKMVNGRGFTVEICHSQSATGYDLCSSCAKISSAHEETGHHFALWITR